MAIASVNPATGESSPRSNRSARRRRARSCRARSRRSRSTAPRRSRSARSGCSAAAASSSSAPKRSDARSRWRWASRSTAAVAEVRKCATACRHYAEHAERYLAPEHIKTDAQRELRALRPARAGAGGDAVELSVLAGLPLRRAGADGGQRRPAQARVERAAVRAGDRGHPARGRLRSRRVPDAADRVGQVAALLDDERVKAATLTGSEPAGASVASHAAKRIKKSVLELGGSDPFVVMPSADLDAAVKTAVKARIVNNGQSCIAAKRFIVHEQIADEFERASSRRWKRSRSAIRWTRRPTSDRSRRRRSSTTSRSRSRRASSAGAKLLTGGKRRASAATSTRRRCWRTSRDRARLRGGAVRPGGVAVPRERPDEAIQLANATPFGLGASVWTNDAAEAERFIAEIESGQVSSTPWSPPIRACRSAA